MELKAIKSLLSLSIIAWSVIFTSCGNDDETPPVDTTDYSVITYVDGQTYLVSAESLDEGFITSEGQGQELDIWLSRQAGDYLYLFNATDYTLDKYSLSESVFTKVDAISLSQIIPGGRPRVMQISADGSLLSINGWPSPQSVVEYGVISLDDFSVAQSGTVTLPFYDNSYTAGFGGAELLISEDKAYFAVFYVNEARSTPGLSTVVYDYPSFENPTISILEGAYGTVAGHVGSTNVIDEKGDIYQVNLTSDLWFGLEVPFTPVVAKLTNGAYDASYNFDLASAFDKPVDVWGLMYAGNGIAYVRASYSDQTLSEEDPWKALTTGNSLFLVKLDLYNKTATKLNVPLSAMYYTQDGVAEEGTFYFPISVLGSKSNIYAFDINGGANDFEVGAELEGENVTVGNLFAN